MKLNSRQDLKGEAHSRPSVQPHRQHDDLTAVTCVCCSCSLQDPGAPSPPPEHCHSWQETGSSDTGQCYNGHPLPTPILRRQAEEWGDTH